jgi:hypothetical protein
MSIPGNAAHHPLVDGSLLVAATSRTISSAAVVDLMAFTSPLKGETLGAWETDATFRQGFGGIP